MRVFVTGADGLLGSNLVRALLYKGHSVIALVCPGSKSRTLDELDLKRICGDLLDDNLDYASILEDADSVIHCAAITDLWAAPSITWRVNFEGTRKLLDACIGANLQKVVVVGSASSYQPGPVDAPGDETGAFPEVYRGAAYMESKRAADELTVQYAKERNLNAVVVSPTFLIGPHDSRPSGGELIKRYIEEYAGIVAPGGRSFAYAPNVAKAAVNALDKGEAGARYILGGENMSYIEFFSRVARISGAKPPARTLPRYALLAGGVAASLAEKALGRRFLFNHDIARASLVNAYYDSSKAARELGLQKTDVDLAIEDSIASLIEQGHLQLPGAEKFKGKVALVTGASRGLGFALSRAMVLRGAKVVLTARGEERLMESRDKLARIGGDVAALSGDVGNRADAKAIVSRAVDEYGRLDIVVNNAGISMRGAFDELSPEVCERVSRTNWDGCMLVSHAAIEHLKRSRGSLIFISSIAGIFGLPGSSIYCATKKALTGLAESLWIELAHKGVHVGVVYLGFTEHDPEKRIIEADGSMALPLRPAHHTQAEAADLVIRMIAKRRRKLVMTPLGRAGALVYRLSPSFLERAVIFAQSTQPGILRRFW